MIQFNAKQIYQFFLTWCMGLIFLFTSYTFMEDVLYRKFLGLNFENPLLAVLLCLSALFFGATMTYAGIHGYDLWLKLLGRRLKTTIPGLSDMLQQIELEGQWPAKKEKKQYKRTLEKLNMMAMFFGTSYSCLIIFAVKLVIELRFYNYSNIQYFLMFLAFSWIFLKEMNKLHQKIELVRNTCTKMMSDIY